MKYEEKMEYFKKYFKIENNTTLKSDEPIVLRFDGADFKAIKREFDRPFDDVFKEAMLNSSVQLMKETNAIFGFTFSDEVNLVLYSDWGDYFYDGRKEKLISVYTSSLTNYFNKELMALSDDERYRSQVFKAKFDGRAFNLPVDELRNYFIFRQELCRETFLGKVVAYESYMGRLPYVNFDDYSSDEFLDLIEGKNPEGMKWERYLNGTAMHYRENKLVVRDDLELFSDRFYL